MSYWSMNANIWQTIFTPKQSKISIIFGARHLLRCRREFPVAVASVTFGYNPGGCEQVAATQTQAIGHAFAGVVLRIKVKVG